MTRWLLWIVPERWRASVVRDLCEEAGRAGLAGRRRHRWIAWHTVRVGLRLRLRLPLILP